MITRIVTPITGPNSDGSSWCIDVQESWDDVMNRVYPVHPPTSSLEHRENIWYTKLDGGRVAIPSQNIFAFEEILGD